MKNKQTNRQTNRQTDKFTTPSKFIYIEILDVPIDLENKEYLVGLAEVIIEDQLQFTSLKHSSIRICSEICESQIFGCHLMPLLRVVYIEQPWIVFENPHYVRVSKDYFPLICIKVNSTNKGPAYNGLLERKVLLKLHFKEIESGIYKLCIRVFNRLVRRLRSLFL